MSYDYPFLRLICKMGGMPEEEIEDLVKKVEADPKSYIEVLKHFEDDEDDKAEKRPLH